MDIREYNRQAWDGLVRHGNQWTVPVTSEQIEAAKRGELEIVLTPKKPVPANWYPQLNQCETLCLASGGGQQGPILAAAGANVMVFDNSPEQLAQDVAVADREGLALKTSEGDMRDLSAFADNTFDLIFHPCSISFIPDPQPVFDEVFRVLKPGGVYLLGACNPIVYIFDYDQYQKGKFVVRHSIPYADQSSLTEAELKELKDQNEPLCFGHSLESILGGQLKAGLHMTDFFEDIWGDGPDSLLDSIMPSMLAMRSIKPE